MYHIQPIIFILTSRQYNQYRRPSEPVRLLEEDGDSRVYGESPELEGYNRERVGEERREMPPFSEQGEMHVQDGSRREDIADLSLRDDEEVDINEVVDE